MAGTSAGLIGLKSYLWEYLLFLDKFLAHCQGKVTIFNPNTGCLF